MSWSTWLQNMELGVKFPAVPPKREVRKQLHGLGIPPEGGTGKPRLSILYLESPEKVSP